MPNEQVIRDAYSHLAELKAEALALDESTLVGARVSRERFLELLTELADRIGPVLDAVAPKLAAEYVASLRATARRIVPLALAFFAADLDTEAGFTDADKQRRKELSARIREYDRRMFPTLELLWGEDATHGPTIAAIRSGSGLRDDSADVLAGRRLAAADPATFARQQLISVDDLELWSREATELLTLVDKVEAKNPARDLQRRVFNLGLRAFDELNWVARFATRDLDAWPGVSSRQGLRAVAAGPSDGDGGTSRDEQPTVST